jgi:hypothetical protein
MQTHKNEETIISVSLIANMQYYIVDEKMNLTPTQRYW